MVEKLSSKGELLTDKLAGILISFNSGRALPINKDSNGKYRLDISCLGKFQMEDLKK